MWFGLPSEDFDGAPLPIESQASHVLHLLPFGTSRVVVGD
jgi:hypothetical protein